MNLSRNQAMITKIAHTNNNKLLRHFNNKIVYVNKTKLNI